MSGNKIELQMWADISKMGGVEKILERVENGDSIQKMADELGVSRSFLSWKVNAIPGVKDKLVQARKGRADKWAEDALHIADNTPEDPNAINKAKMRIETRKWLAGVDDPERYGVKGAQVNISIGGLHLDALRKVQAEMAKPIGQMIDGEATDVTDQ